MNDRAQPSPPDPRRGGGHETTDVNPSLVGLSALGLAIMIGIVLCLLAWTYTGLQSTAARRDRAAGPHAVAPVPPEPRLEPDPPAALARWRAEQERKRTGAGPVEGEPGIVRIPVERAIAILVERGFPELAGQPEPAPVRGETP